MIYITGDTHGDISRFSEEQMPLSAGDKVIVTGDFGFVFHNNLAEKNNLDALAKTKPFEILFLPGNHENYPALKAYPEVERYGGPTRKVRENIYMLQRGVYTIEGLSFFVFGGGYSVDKARRLEYQRFTGEKVWFEEEMPSPEEYYRALESLKAHDMKVDYVLTHTAPGTIFPDVIGKMPDPNEKELNDFLDDIYTNVYFREYYFGHLHKDQRVNDRMVACYKTLHCLEKNN